MGSPFRPVGLVPSQFSASCLSWKCFVQNNLDFELVDKWFFQDCASLLGETFLGFLAQTAEDPSEPWL